MSRMAGNLTCNMCNVNFPTQDALRQHNRETHPGREMRGGMKR